MTTCKKFLTIALTAVSLTAVFAACNSFLEENPRGQLTEKEAYASKQDIFNNGVLAIYNYIGGYSDSQGLQGTGRGVFDFNSLTTDEAIAPTRASDWYDGGFWETLFTHNWTPGTASMKDMWDYLYKVVMMTDKFIVMIENRDDYPADQDLIAYHAELRAVRAMFHFYIMDLFGNVPIVTTDEILAEDIVQSKRSEVFRFCVSELQEALPWLLEDRSNLLGESYGRVTQPVALFLLAKLMINAEIYADDDWTDGVSVDGRSVTFNIGGKTMNAWDACEYYCEQLEYFDYRLEDLFDANFRVTNEYSSENIFTIPMDPVLYSNWFIYLFRSRHSSHGAVLGGSSENGMSATLELVNAFRYGQPDEDPRFAYTFYADTVWENYKLVLLDDGVTPLVYYPLDVALDVTATPHEKTAGARFHKYEPDPDANADGRACNNDIVLFRYADVLLMKAEAQVRNGKDGSDALNAVRERVLLPPVTATLENILNERYLELAWEGWRRNDMVRFGIFTREYSDHAPSDIDLSGAANVFPIPADIMTMHPSWKQNPGY